MLKNEAAPPPLRNAFISNIFPYSKKCALIYSGLGIEAKDFLLKDCLGKLEKYAVFKFRYIQKLAFAKGLSGFGIIGDSFASFEGGGDGMDFGLFKPPDGRFEPNDIFFLDASLGWVAANDGIILKTSDGGASWRFCKTGATGEVRRVRFADSKFGWAYSEEKNGPALIISRDGGENWEPSGAAGLKEFSRLFLTSENHGCGLDDKNQLFCTFEGDKWEKIELPPGKYRDIFFTSPKKGWLAGSAISTTDDGGKTWRAVVGGANSPDAPRLYSIVFNGAQNGWAWGPKALFRTHNAGATWQNLFGRVEGLFSIPKAKEPKILPQKAGEDGQAATEKGGEKCYLCPVLIKPQDRYNGLS